MIRKDEMQFQYQGHTVALTLRSVGSSEPPLLSQHTTKASLSLDRIQRKQSIV